MENNSRYLYDLLRSINIGNSTAQYLNLLALILLLVLLFILANFIIKKVLIRTFNEYAKRSKSNFDDFMVENSVPKYLAHILPLIIAYKFIPYVFIDFTLLGSIALKIAEIYAIMLFLWVVRSILNTFKNYFKNISKFKEQTCR